MRHIESQKRQIAVAAILVLCATGSPALAQPDIRVTAGDATDARISGGFQTGELSVVVRIRGDGIEGVAALRYFLTDARDDLGNLLLPETPGTPGFRDVRGDRAEETIRLRSPARDATSFLVSGRVELFIPGRDPNATVKVANALAHPNKPLSSPGLKAADLEVVVLTRAGLPREMVAFHARTADFERIHSIRILRPDGTEIPVGSTARSSDGESTDVYLEASEPVPKNASLSFSILTAKACASVPFELKDIPLP